MNAMSIVSWAAANKALSLVFMLLMSGGFYLLIYEPDYSECEQDTRCLTIAYQVQEDYQIWDTNPQQLADKLSSIMGDDWDVEIYPVSDSGPLIEAIDKGNADIGFVDGAAAWLAWEVYDLDVLAAETKSDGRTYYNAAAWVRADSDMAAAYLDDDPNTDPFALMEGKKSCHTGWLKSAGMLIPMGYLIGNGYAEVIGDPTEIDSLEATVYGFFSEDSSIPRGSSPYSSYKGAMRCMMEGAGDIALIKDTVYDSYCTGSDAYDWCLDRDEVVMLEPFGQAPSHPALYNPENMDLETISLVHDALGALDEDQEGADILWDLLYTKDMIPTNAEDHLGTYGAAVSNVPGIQAYFG